MSNKFALRIGTLLICGLSLMPVAMHGSVIYTYTGKPLAADPSDGCGGCLFNPGFTSETGYFSVGTALPDSMGLTNIISQITSFSFSDGISTISGSAPAAPDQFYVATSPTGNIDAWGIQVIDPNGTFLICNGDTSLAGGCSPGNGWGNGGAADEVFDGGGVGLNESDPGTWVETPEPSSVALLGSGILGLVGTLRRKMKQ